MWASVARALGTPVIVELRFSGLCLTHLRPEVARRTSRWAANARPRGVPLLTSGPAGPRVPAGARLDGGPVAAPRLAEGREAWRWVAEGRAEAQPNRRVVCSSWARPTTSSPDRRHRRARGGGGGSRLGRGGHRASIWPAPSSPTATSTTSTACRSCPGGTSCPSTLLLLMPAAGAAPARR